MLVNTSNQPFKIRTKNWVEINDDAWETYSTDSHIKFKTAILKSSLCDCSDAYILATGNTTVAGVGATAAARTTDIEMK